MQSVECPVCHQSKLVQISLKVAGKAVSMQSCSRCDSRWWRTEGSAAGLSKVLELASAGRG